MDRARIVLWMLLSLVGLLAAGLAAVVASAQPAGDEAARNEATLRIVADPAAAKLARVVGESVRGTSVRERAVGNDAAGDALHRIRPWLDGAADMLLTATPLTREETTTVLERLHRAPIAHVLAIDALAVYVHVGSRVRDIEFAKLRDVYAGRITNWREIGGDDVEIVPYLPRRGTDTYRYVTQELFPGVELGANVRFADSEAEIARLIRAGSPTAIGLGSFASSEEIVRVIGVSAAAGAPAYRPITEDMRERRYPYRRELFAYTLDRPAGPARQWLDAVRTEAMQETLHRRGYFPLYIQD